MSPNFDEASSADQQSVWHSPAITANLAPGVQGALASPIQYSGSFLESGGAAQILASAFESRFGVHIGPLFDISSTPPPPAEWKSNFEQLLELLSKKPIDPDAITLWLQLKLDAVSTTLSLLATLEAGIDKERIQAKIKDLGNQWLDVRSLLLAVLTAGAAGGRGPSAASDVTWLLYSFAKCDYYISDVVRWGKYYKKLYEGANR